MFRFIISLMLLCSTAYGGRYVFGTAVCEDAYFLAAAPTTNYGSATLLDMSASGVDNRGAVIRYDNVRDSLYAAAGGNITVENCSLRVYVYEGVAENATIVARRMFKTAFVESEITWNVWSTTNEWGSAGCNSSDDGGSDNTGDGTSADRKATSEGATPAIVGVGYYNIPISAALLQDRFDTDAALCLYLTRGGTNQYPRIYSSEGTYPPTLIVNYSVTGGGSELLWPILK